MKVGLVLPLFTDDAPGVLDFRPARGVPSGTTVCFAFDHFFPAGNVSRAAVAGGVHELSARWWRRRSASSWAPSSHGQ
jgi:hypothetical protein